MKILTPLLIFLISISLQAKFDCGVAIKELAKEVVEGELRGRSHPAPSQCLKQGDFKSYRLRWDPPGEVRKISTLMVTKWGLSKVITVDKVIGHYRAYFWVQTEKGRMTDTIDFMEMDDQRLGCAMALFYPKRSYLLEGCR